MGLPNLQKDSCIRRIIITNILVNIHIAFHNRERKYISYPACGSRNEYDRDVWEPLDTRTSAVYPPFNGFFVCYLDVLVTYKMHGYRIIRWRVWDHDIIWNGLWEENEWCSIQKLNEHSVALILFQCLSTYLRKCCVEYDNIKEWDNYWKKIKKLLYIKYIL